MLAPTFCIASEIFLSANIGPNILANQGNKKLAYITKVGVAFISVIQTKPTKIIVLYDVEPVMRNEM